MTDAIHTGFVPHHREVAAPGHTPAGWMLVLHGIYGRGDNWRTFAGELVKRRPDWGLVLVDLRMHGRSMDAPPPHDVGRAAADLLALEQALGEEEREVRAVFGHSFGGKVALRYAQERAARTRLGWPTTFVIDASPSPRPGAMAEADNVVSRALRAMERRPGPFPSRADFVRALGQDDIPRAIGQWLAMNLEGRDGEYHLKLEPEALGALLADYYELDAWPIVEGFADEARVDEGRLVVVIGGRSEVIDAPDRTRLAGLAASGGALSVVTIEPAGHWVHMDAPDALLDIAAKHLPHPG